jgi:hypothetical protein
MEKINQLGEPTDEERLSWKHLPDGEKLAGKYLKEEDFNLLVELGKHSEEIKNYVARGAAAVLIGNISLPRNDVIKKTNKKVMDGLKILKNDKVSVENVYSQIRQLFTHFAEQGEQQRQQAYQSLKAQVAGQIQQAVQQQGGAVPAQIDVEKQPQFQQEWRRVLTQLDSQYTTLLSEHKQELEKID